MDSGAKSMYHGFGHSPCEKVHVQCVEFRYFVTVITAILIFLGEMLSFRILDLTV